MNHYVNNIKEFSPMHGENKRKSCNSFFRKEVDEGIGRLRTLHSVLENARVQNLPQESTNKIKEFCSKLEKELVELGLPQLRVMEIIRGET